LAALRAASDGATHPSFSLPRATAIAISTSTDKGLRQQRPSGHSHCGRSHCACSHTPRTRIPLCCMSTCLRGVSTQAPCLRALRVSVPCVSPPPSHWVPEPAAAGVFLAGQRQGRGT